MTYMKPDSFPSSPTQCVMGKGLATRDSLVVSCIHHRNTTTMGIYNMVYRLSLQLHNNVFNEVSMLELAIYRMRYFASMF